MLVRWLFWFPKRILQLALVVAAGSSISWFAFADKVGRVRQHGEPGRTVNLVGRIGRVIPDGSALGSCLYSLRGPTGVIWIRSSSGEPRTGSVAIVRGEVSEATNPKDAAQSFLYVRERRRWASF